MLHSGWGKYSRSLAINTSRMDIQIESENFGILLFKKPLVEGILILIFNNSPHWLRVQAIKPTSKCVSFNKLSATKISVKNINQQPVECPAPHFAPHLTNWAISFRFKELYISFLKNNVNMTFLHVSPHFKSKFMHVEPLNRPFCEARKLSSHLSTWPYK